MRFIKCMAPFPSRSTLKSSSEVLKRADAIRIAFFCRQNFLQVHQLTAPRSVLSHYHNQKAGSQIFIMTGLNATRPLSAPDRATLTAGKRVGWGGGYPAPGQLPACPPNSSLVAQTTYCVKWQFHISATSKTMRVAHKEHNSCTNCHCSLNPLLAISAQIT